MVITSIHNTKVKQYVKLMRQKKERERTGKFIVEGEHLVFEAIEAGVVEEILVLQGKDVSLEKPYTVVAPEVMNKICDTKTPQGIIACCRMKKPELILGKRILILEDIQDPGNLGTLMRSADAFGFDGLILSPRTVDRYNPKVVRSTQGAIFRMSTIVMPVKEAIQTLQNNGFYVCAADLDGIPLDECNPKEKMAFVLGNEGQGIRPEVREMVHDCVTIEMTGQSESLNVSVAGSIIMYKFRN